MTPFQEAVVDAVNEIPRGKVASYGQVAAWIGSPRAARQVGWILRGLTGRGNHPWWRVVNTAGRISIRGNDAHDKPDQKALLEAEGVAVSPDFKIDMKRFRFRPSPAQLKHFSDQQRMLASLPESML